MIQAMAIPMIFLFMEYDCSGLILKYKARL